MLLKMEQEGIIKLVRTQAETGEMILTSIKINHNQDKLQLLFDRVPEILKYNMKKSVI